MNSQLRNKFLSYRFANHNHLISNGQFNYIVRRARNAVQPPVNNIQEEGDIDQLLEVDVIEIEIDGAGIPENPGNYFLI